MAQAASPPDDHDSPWKETLEQFLPQCLALFAPKLHAIIDWSHPPEFLDKELQAIAVPRRGTSPRRSGHRSSQDSRSGRHGGSADPARAGAPSHPGGIDQSGRFHRLVSDGAFSGRRYADKLVLVRCLDGRTARLLIHIEIQGGAHGPRARVLFARRMFQYRYRLQDRHGTRSGQAFYSLGILTASRGGDSHLVHCEEFLDQGIRFTFPVVHMAQWLERWDELEALAPSNPFAVVVMAHLTALRLRNKAARLDPKVELMRRMTGYGYARREIDALARLVDWIIRLPERLEPDYMRALETLEQEHAVTYITTPERVGLRRGRLEGRLEGQVDLLLRQLARRFGEVPEVVTERVRSATAEQLETWSLNFVDAVTLDEVFAD